MKITHIRRKSIWDTDRMFNRLPAVDIEPLHGVQNIVAKYIIVQSSASCLRELFGERTALMFRFDHLPRIPAAMVNSKSSNRQLAGNLQRF